MFESGFKVDIIKLYTYKNTSHGQGKSLNYFSSEVSRFSQKEID